MPKTPTSPLPAPTRRPAPGAASYEPSVPPAAPQAAAIPGAGESRAFCGVGPGRGRQLRTGIRCGQEPSPAAGDRRPQALPRSAWSSGLTGPTLATCGRLSLPLAGEGRVAAAAAARPPVEEATGEGQLAGCGIEHRLSGRGWIPRRVAAGMAAALLLVATISLAGPARAEPLVDARGTPVGTPDTSRIVSIGGAVTEILYDLGLEDRIVAVDTTSTAPARALAEKPNVGYMRALSAEGVLSTGPSLIVATEGAGPPEVVEVLAASSVPVVLVDDATTPEAVAGRIRFLAAAMGAEERGAELAGEVEDGFATLAAARAGIRSPARVLFVISLRDGVPMAAGTGTAADAIIGLAGGVNVAAGFEGYKPMSEEAVLAAAPDVVLMMTSGAHAAGGDVLALPAFRGTPAAANGRLVTMDGQSLLGFGPRTPAVARALAAELHPGQIAKAGTP